MKKIHITLLIITLALAVFSAYSLAAINQVYKIDFKWYSEYNQSFLDEVRNLHDEKWTISKYPDKMLTEVFWDRKGINHEHSENEGLDTIINSFDFKKDILLFCSLGKVNSPEYRIKVTDIAQRGNVVEIKVSLNSPTKLENSSEHSYYPYDMVKIKKDDFIIKGKLFFIFKNQAGNKIGERSLKI